MPATQLLRALPSVDALLRTPAARALAERTGSSRLTALARGITDELRAELQAHANADDAAANGDFTREALLAEAVARLERAVSRADANNLRRVVNATGVILHTNLGRAPLSEAARRAVSEEAAGYCTLEYDLATGARGRRGARVEESLAELTGAEAALVVNNCAAAALLILSTLARGGETIISRGELVEIGGDFRVPDVMAESGTSMVEVGTTNRTRLADYERAIRPETRLILRVHPSNYRIVGFTAAPALAALAALAHENDLPLYEDAGSGALLDLGAYNLQDEPVIRESIEQGADIVSFSGDKLVGATQAGLIVGRSALVERCRRNPLYRALRADKLALAALAATLDAHARGATFSEVPALRMLAATRAEVEKRARAFVRRASSGRGACELKFEIIAGESAIGGGSAPTTHPPTALIALTHEQLSATALEARLRQSSPPVIARILDERVVLDLRTVAGEEEPELLAALAAL
ncbi:MAG TPA: L-seryl-tRNA(Sec) selenium transferase [Pyrinomonadaceae bacterium]|nr:L-seryl-tRNA(Sec) selenium transferase [Pyrinomonadaceae bacterium]